MYGTIRMHQERRFPGRVVGTALKNPDFAALAAAYGAFGAAVARTEEFAPAFEAALAARRAAIIELQDGPGDHHDADHPRRRCAARPKRRGRLMAKAEINRIARQNWQAGRYAATAHFVPALGDAGPRIARRRSRASASSISAAATGR